MKVTPLVFPLVDQAHRTQIHASSLDLDAWTLEAACLMVRTGPQVRSPH